MKKLLLLIPFLALSYYAQAQCVPDTSIHEDGMSPDSFPNGKVGVAYSQVFQFKFPPDTMTPFGTVVIDSVIVTSVDSLPTGFTYVCNVPRCSSYPGGANGCVTVSGTPDSAKTYPVTITLIAWGTVAGNPIPGEQKVQVDFTVDSAAVGLFKQSHVNWNFAVSQNKPNPFSSSTEISFTLPQSQAVTFQVYDILGKPVIVRNINGVRGENTITVDRKGMNAGMYFYSIQYGNQMVTKRMSVRN
jgi:hypothetical protein